MNKLENCTHVHIQNIILLIKYPTGLKQVFMESQRTHLCSLGHLGSGLS